MREKSERANTQKPTARPAATHNNALGNEENAKTPNQESQ